jgi:hypothetical protein
VVANEDSGLEDTKIGALRVQVGSPWNTPPPNAQVSRDTRIDVKF